MNGWRSYKERKKLWIITGCFALLFLVEYKYVLEELLNSSQIHQVLTSENVSLENRKNSTDSHRSVHLVKFSSTSAFHEAVLSLIAENVSASQVKFVTLSEPVIVELFGHQVVLIEAALEGNFKNQIQVIHDIEYQQLGLYLQSVEIKNKLKNHSSTRNIYSVIKIAGIVK
ncbi:MAG: hypothetical protein RIF46_01405 [Cyclobacteriaceae bacterium]